MRVCRNRTCSRQGSRQVLKFAEDLALTDVTAIECGCLGSCGLGPNVAVVPISENASRRPVLLHHVSTFSDLVEVLRSVCEAELDDDAIRATELRILGNQAAHNEDLQLAIQLYTEALLLGPRHGKHLLLSNRSAARLASGDVHAAVDDAREATGCCPDDFTTAAVRLADAQFALGRYDESLEALMEGGRRHPSWTKSLEFRNLYEAVVQKARGNARAKHR